MQKASFLFQKTLVYNKISLDTNVKKNQNAIKGISVFMLLFKNYYGKSTVKSKKCFQIVKLQNQINPIYKQKKSCQIMATLNKHEDIKRESIKNFV